VNGLYSLLSSIPISKATCVAVAFLSLILCFLLFFTYTKKNRAYIRKCDFIGHLYDQNKKAQDKHEKELSEINAILSLQKEKITSLYQNNASIFLDKFTAHFDNIFLNEDKDDSILKVEVSNQELKNALVELNTERIRAEALFKLFNDSFTDSHGEYLDVKNEVIKKKAELDYIVTALDEAEDRLSEIQDEIIRDDEESLYQSYSLYRNKYEYKDCATYNVLIAENRNQQRAMLKKHCAVSFLDTITTDDGKTSLNKKFEKLYLSCFNSICDKCISELTFANHQTMKDKIEKSFNDLNETFPEFALELYEDYLELKISELELVYESIKVKKIEQERIRAEKERQKEDAWVKKQLKEERETLSKERQHYSKHLKLLREQLKSATAENRFAIQEKITEHENVIEELDVKIQEVDYRQINERAGYVYIISNIGSFGENVYKIGMSRRLDPLERVDELSSASVPFRFDVHALIFSEDAYGLESSLHSAFEDKRVNMVNGRKEFYRVSLEEIENVVKKYHDQTVQFTKHPAAEQYRESIRMQRYKRK
jgi:hypothetical protein